jgi:hypothetical protein
MRQANLALQQAPVRPRLLSILSPPRSFSSVISTMIGQHPEMYGFPELHLMMGDTLDSVLHREQRRSKYFGPPGMLRTLAELDSGEQTVDSIFDAHNWLYARRNWTTKQAMDYVMDRVAETSAARICVEKSPSMSKDIKSLNRQHRYYPDALYLHLTRHPLGNVASMEEYVLSKNFDDGVIGESSGRRLDPRADFERVSAIGFAYWALCHTNILKFLRTIPSDRVFRVKGEDLLSEPEIWLPKICRWAGVDDGPASVEAMLHPEHSPYAVPGPVNARGGNDAKFTHSPGLRRGRVKEPNLHEALSKPPLRGQLTEQQRKYLLALIGSFGYQ